MVTNVLKINKEKNSVFNINTFIKKCKDFFNSIKETKDNLSSTKELSIEDEVQRLHYILTNNYSLDEQNKLLLLLINKTFEERQNERRALEASLASLKALLSNSPNINLNIEQ